MNPERATVTTLSKGGAKSQKIGTRSQDQPSIVL
jgi:hypothetical protein